MEKFYPRTYENLSDQVFFSFQDIFKKVNTFEERITRVITPVFGSWQKCPVKMLLSKDVDVTGAPAEIQRLPSGISSQTNAF